MSSVTQNIDTKVLTCLAGDAVNDAVYLSAANTVAQADATNGATMPALGFIISKPTTTTCIVRMQGEVDGFVGLTAAADYYIDDAPGAISATPGSNVQLVGRAKNTTTLIVNCTPNALVLDDMVAAGAAGTVEANKAVVVDGSKDIAAFGTLGLVNLDAGSSGVAGTVDIFPTTAAKGKLAVTKADNTNNDTTTLNVAAQGQAGTITVPDPLVAAADVILGKQAAVARTATADGLTTGTIAAAGKIQSITVTSASVDHIVVLPTPTPGTLVILYVGANGFELRSSDPENISINGGAAVDAESAIPADTVVYMYCASATAWVGFQLADDGTVSAVEAAAAA